MDVSWHQESPRSKAAAMSLWSCCEVAVRSNCAKPLRKATARCHQARPLHEEAAQSHYMSMKPPGEGAAKPCCNEASRKLLWGCQRAPSKPAITKTLQSSRKATAKPTQSHCEATAKPQPSSNEATAKPLQSPCKARVKLLQSPHEATLIKLLYFLLDPWIFGLWVRYYFVVLSGSLDPWILRNSDSDSKITFCGFGWIPGSLDPWILRNSDSESKISFFGWIPRSLNPWIPRRKSRCLFYWIPGSLDP